MLGQAGLSSRNASARRMPLSVRLCATLTFILELPCFWYALAMGWTLQINLVDLWRGTDAAPVRERIAAYVIVILPVLAVSALAEAYAVSSMRYRDDFGEDGL